VEKYGRAGQATSGSINWGMRFACWITKATDTQSEHTTANIALRRTSTSVNLLGKVLWACQNVLRGPVHFLAATYKSSTVTSYLPHTTLFPATAQSNFYDRMCFGCL
jgi:hypothetical protein